VNLKATAFPPTIWARACVEAMWKEDDASKGLGMEILQIKAGEGRPDDDGQAETWSTAHGNRPWRLHFRLGRLGIGLCLQFLQ